MPNEPNTFVLYTKLMSVIFYIFDQLFTQLFTTLVTLTQPRAFTFAIETIHIDTHTHTHTLRRHNTHRHQPPSTPLRTFVAATNTGQVLQVLGRIDNERGGLSVSIIAFVPFNEGGFILFGRR